MVRIITSMFQSPYMRALKIGLIGLGGVILLTSCIVSRHPHGIISSSKPIPPEYVVLTSVEESSCRPWFLLIPFGGKSTSEEMMADLVTEHGADALVGVTVEHTESLFSIPIMGSECTVVNARAVRVMK